MTEEKIKQLFEQVLKINESQGIIDREVVAKLEELESRIVRLETLVIGQK